jgi:hypothetical protein
MQIRLACLPAVALALAAATPAFADNIPVYGTGVDSSGTPLATGALDPHYVLIGNGSPRVARAGDGPVGPGGWLPDEDGLSAWVGPAGTDEIFDTPPALWDFQTTFTLGHLQAASAILTGRWATDDYGFDILINGQSTFNTSSSFQSWSNFTISSGFVEGLNTLDFIVYNTGGPGGFRAEVAGTADPAVPEPASWALMLGGFGLVGGALRRRKAAISFA